MFEKSNFVDIILSSGELPYVFLCIKCYTNGQMQLWKYKSSSRNFSGHQQTFHGLVLDKIEWKMQHRLQLLQPTIEYVCWDRNSFNETKGDGLASLLKSVFNLGVQIGIPTASIGVSFINVLSFD